MSPRLSSKGISSFISFYSCARSFPSTLPPTRGICLSTSRPSVRKPSTTLSHRRRFHASSPSYASKDPYEVLGVKKDAPAADIKKTYFSLARKYHPDTNPDKDAKAKFVEIQEAYDTLKDEKKRAAYDQYGAASQQPGFDPNAFARNPFGGGAGGFSGFHDFGSAFSGGGQANSDLFDQLFGAFGGRPRGGRSPFAETSRGDNIETVVGVSFLEAAKGATRNVTITPVINCSTCSGNGMKAGAKRTTCPSCHGSGTRTFVIDSGFQMASTCTTCQGVGSTIPRGSQCGTCDGVGKVQTRKTVKVDIPPGVEDGMTLRIPNAGDAPLSGKGSPGDLLVRVNVASSKVFRRQGSNLYHEARIPLHTALLGGRVRVPTLEGDVDVRVPGGTQHGEEMVLKDRGMSSLMGRSTGDLFVTFAVQLPRSLTPRQREILQQYADDVEGRQPTDTSRPTQNTSGSSNGPSSTGSGRSSTATNDNDEVLPEPGSEASESDRGEQEEKKKKRATA